MSKPIRLHRQYGLNPTIMTCIICGKDKNEIALLGASYKGQAPMHMTCDVVPCATCREKYLSQGVLLVEATRLDEHKLIISGRVMVISDDGFKRAFTCPMPPDKISYIDSETYNMLLTRKKLFDAMNETMNEAKGA